MYIVFHNFYNIYIYILSVTERPEQEKSMPLKRMTKIDKII